MTLSSYQNHLTHLVTFFAILISALTKIKQGSSNLATNITCGVGVLLMAWAIKSEITYIWLRRRMPPGDSGWPFLGHLPNLLGKNPFQFHLDRVRRYGKTYTINFFMTPMLYCITSEDLQWGVSQERKANARVINAGFLTRLLGSETILNINGSHHRRLRRLMESAFAPQSVRDYVSLLDETTKPILKSWADTSNFQTLKVVSLLSMRIFFVCAVGQADEDLMRTISPLFKIWMSGFTTPIPISYPNSVLDKAFKAREKLKVYLSSYLNEYRAQHPNETKTLLSRLCYSTNEDGESLTEQQLIENFMFLVFAGHDTTKGSLGSMLYYLSQYPHISKLLHEEVSQFSSLDPDTLTNAPLLNAFMSESWRLRPPVAGHFLQAHANLEYRHWKIPQGAGIGFANQVTSFLDYRDPLDFKLERWIPVSHELHDPEYFVQKPKPRTFGSGPHTCLGVHFAKMTLRVVLTRLLRDYTVVCRNAETVWFPVLHENSEFRLVARAS